MIVENMFGQKYDPQMLAYNEYSANVRLTDNFHINVILIDRKC